MINDEIKNKYKQVENILEDAMNMSNSINILGEEENIELSHINQMLTKLNASFKTEIQKLESSSEWEKFCIAFFGETNAGKSTIIESLRIMYDEETRRTEILKQSEEYKQNLEKYHDNFKDMIEELESLNTMLSNKKSSYKLKPVILSVTSMLIGLFLGFLIAKFGLI